MKVRSLLTTALFFISQYALANTNVLFYKDGVLVRINLKTNIIYLPNGDYNMKIEDNTILESFITNITDNKLLAELSNILKEIKYAESKMQDTQYEINRLNDNLDILKIIIGSSGQKDQKSINSLVEEYNNIYKKIINLKKELQLLETQKEDKEKIVKELEEKIASSTQTYKVFILSKPFGTLNLLLSGGWESSYKLNADNNTITTKIIVSLPKGFKFKSYKTTFYTFRMEKEYVRINLDKLIGNIYETRYFKTAIKPSIMKKTMNVDNYEEEEEESERISEKGLDVGIAFELDKEITVENGSEITISTNPISIQKRYIAIPSKYPKGIMTLIISNNLPNSILPGELEISFGQATISGLVIDSVIPRNSVFETYGLLINEIDVKREIVEEKTENPKFLGTNKRIVRVFKNSIKNNLSSDIEITIIDRIPIPSDDRIKIGIERIIPSPTSNYEQIMKESIFNIKIPVAKGKEVSTTVSYWVEYPADLRYYEYER
ncbi:MAG: DUF4139 domain-containing protein [Brevinematales bacterium]|nr:DUF4139 domain-containing protein [Brevinematales bacterium]